MPKKTAPKPDKPMENLSQIQTKENKDMFSDEKLPTIDEIMNKHNKN